MRVELSNIVESAPSSLMFLGQAGFVFESKSSKTLAIDPYLTNCCEKLYGYKRMMPYLIDPKAFSVDAIALTHEHEDHMDVEALPEIAKSCNPVFFASPKACKWLDSNVENSEIVEAKLGVTQDLFDFRITPVEADHGYATPEAMGYIIETCDVRFLVTGDTCLRLDFLEQYESGGKVDVLIAPINGKFGNMDSEDIVALAEKLNSKVVIPTHVWNFIEHGGNFEEFMLRMKTSNLKALALPMRPGETILIEDLIKE